MKLEDPTVLSAYLDDELDATERLELESALRAHPTLRRELRELARVRDLLSGLPRPAAPADVPLKIVVGIDRRRSVRLLTLTTTALTTAAAAFLAMTFLYVGRPSPQPTEPRLIAQSPPTKPGTPPIGIAVNTGNPLGPTSPHPDTNVAPPSAVNELALAQRRRLLDLLEQPDVKRLIVSVAALDQTTVAAFDHDLTTLVRQRPSYCRFEVAQGLEIDPTHPGDAIVFAVEVDPRELRALVARLSRSPHLTGAIRGDQPSPDTLLQLAEVPNLAVEEGRRGSLLVSEAEVQNRIGVEVREFMKSAPSRDLPDPEFPRSPRVSEPILSEGAEPGSTQPAPFLIWLVTQPPAD